MRRIVHRIWHFVARPEHSNGIIAVFTIVIAMSSIGYIVVGIYQWRANREAADAALSAAKTAGSTLAEVQGQTALMRQQLVGTQAASIAITEVVIDPTLDTLNVSLQNDGVVDARHVNLTYHIQKESLPGEVFIGKPTDVNVQDFILKGKGSFRRTTPFYWKQPIFANKVGWPGKETWVVSGHFTYENGFGEKMPAQRFCFFYLPRYNINGKYHIWGAGGGFVGEGENCDIQNAIRQYYERLRLSNTPP
jgi:hypothetical protein